MPDPLAQRIVPFYGDDLVAVQQQDGVISVLFARLCENLRLVRAAQVKRIRRHDVLHEGLTTVIVQTDGGLQEAQCLRLDLLPLWLSGLQAGRVKEELQPKLIRYQHEAAIVLWQAFKDQLLVEDVTVEPADDKAILQLQQIAEMGRAIVRMAEQQIELQRQQSALNGRMDAAARVIRGVQGTLDNVVGQLTRVDVRLGVLEDKVYPAAYISDAQATEISNKVKGLGELLSRTQAGKNHYQGIFAELYRRFGVSSYKLIRQEQYAGVLAFLEEWHRSTAE